MGKLAPFALERYFAKWESKCRYNACASDPESLPMSRVVSEMMDAEVRSLWDELSLAYTESQGMPLLRREIAAATGDGVDADSVVVVVPEEGIFVAMHALLAAGDHVVACAPAYQSLHEVARSVGAAVTLWEAEERTDASGAPHLAFDVAHLRSLVRAGKTKLVVVNFPHNPSGALLSRAEFEEVVAVARDAGAYLFSDEMYRGLELDTAARLPCAATLYERAISLSGMSKVYGAPGLRLGWLVVPDAAVRADVCRIRDYTTICHVGPSELLALAILRRREQTASDVVARIKAHQRLWTDFCERHADVFYPFHAPAATTMGLVRLRPQPWLAGDSNGQMARDFCDRTVVESGVLLMPLTALDPAGADREFMRTTVRVGLGRADLPACLEALGQYLDGLRPAGV